MTQQMPAEYRTRFDLEGIDPFDLSGRHALVTAATTGSARAFATALAETGADVSLTTLRDDEGEEAKAKEILEAVTALGRRGVARRVALLNPAAVEAAVTAIESAVAPVDILVNAAHTALLKPVAEATLEEWRQVLDVNATSVFVACRALAPRMIERGHGRIVNLVSVLHDRGAPNAALFGASQGAVLGFTKSAGLEWGRDTGVTVNALGVGFFEEVPGPQSDPDVASILQRYIPLRRLGRPEDLQGALIYLCSDHAGFVDSEVFMVDGAIAVHA